MMPLENNEPETAQENPPLIIDGEVISISTENFVLTADGLMYDNPDSAAPPKLVSHPIWVPSFTRRVEEDDWGMEIKFINLDGELKSLVVSRDKLGDSRNPVKNRLTSMGLYIEPGMLPKLNEFLGKQIPELRKVAVSKIGWHTIEGSNVFATPNEVYKSGGTTNRVVYQPDNYASTSETMFSQGDLADWQNHVANKCYKNPYLLFGLSAGFSAPLHQLLGLDGGGFHLYGTSSKGKTTEAQVIASIYGCGSDPAVSPKTSYITRWNMTQNATEALAMAHNDHPLIIDELGTSAVRDFGKAIYDLAGGKGKMAMTSNRDVRPPRTWNIMLISTGEYSIKQQIEQSGGMAKAGQLIRLIDIPAGESIIQDSDGKDFGMFAAELKESCGTYFGTAGPIYISKLLEYLDDANYKAELQSEFNQIHQSHVTSNMLAEQQRAVKRFAIAELGGKLAARMDILECSEAQIVEAVSLMLDAWMDASDSVSDLDRGIINIANFILSHPNRFRDMRDPDTHVHNLAGYRHISDGLYLFTEEGFKEACGGHNHKAIAKKLREQGNLITNNGSHMKNRYLITGFSQRISLYAVSDSILSGTDDIALSDDFDTHYLPESVATVATVATVVAEEEPKKTA